MDMFAIIIVVCASIILGLWFAYIVYYVFKFFCNLF